MYEILFPMYQMKKLGLYLTHLASLPIPLPFPVCAQFEKFVHMNMIIYDS
jgi:hypothetical protein